MKNGIKKTRKNYTVTNRKKDVTISRFNIC